MVAGHHDRVIARPERKPRRRLNRVGKNAHSGAVEARSLEQRFPRIDHRHAKAYAHQFRCNPLRNVPRAEQIDLRFGGKRFRQNRAPVGRYGIAGVGWICEIGRIGERHGNDASLLQVANQKDRFPAAGGCRRAQKERSFRRAKALEQDRHGSAAGRPRLPAAAHAVVLPHGRALRRGHCTRKGRGRKFGGAAADGSDRLARLQHGHRGAGTPWHAAARFQHRGQHHALPLCQAIGDHIAKLPHQAPPLLSKNRRTGRAGRLFCSLRRSAAAFGPPPARQGAVLAGRFPPVPRTGR